MRLEPWRVRTRRIADAPTSAAQELGGELFAAFFHDELRDVLVASRSRCPDGLRIRIDLSEAPALTGIPWELLYDRLGNRHLALSERTPVVRYLQLAGTVAPLVVNGPLRILAVLASPSGLQPLDVEPEWEGMSAELAPQVDAGLVALDRLERPTTGDLHRYLRTHEVHVLHFVGHGSFDTAIQDGVLCLEDRRGQAQAITSGKLGPDLYDHDSLRLVVLNACETASSASTDTFSGMAQGLVQQGVPAVVAMQVPITDEAAVCFSRDFYTAIAVGQPVDQALTGARKALHSEFGYEWATPVLFLRTQDAVLFAIEPKTVTTSPRRGPQPAPPSTPTPPKEAGQAAGRPVAEVTEESVHETATEPVRETAVQIHVTEADSEATARSVSLTAEAPEKAVVEAAETIVSTEKGIATPTAQTTPNSTADTIAGPPMSFRDQISRGLVARPLLWTPADPRTAEHQGMQLRVATPDGAKRRTWAQLLDDLDHLTAVPGRKVVVNNARHDSETWISVRRSDPRLARHKDASAYVLEYRYRDASPRYTAGVLALEDAIQVMYVFLQPRATVRHNKLLAWVRIDGPEGDDESRRQMLDLHAQEEAGRFESGRREVGYNVSFRTNSRYDVTLGRFTNVLVFTPKEILVNGPPGLALHKGDWTKIVLKGSDRGGQEMSFHASIKPGGWLTPPCLRIGTTDIVLSRTETSGTVGDVMPNLGAT